ncbi:hypothetical protein D3C78_1376600 [compost metagenome]
MGVVEIQAVGQDAIGQRRGRGRQALAGAEHRGFVALAQCPGAFDRHAAELEAGGREGDAEHVQQVLLGQGLDLGRDGVEVELKGELGEPFGNGGRRRGVLQGHGFLRILF